MRPKNYFLAATMLLCAASTGCSSGTSSQPTAASKTSAPAPATTQATTTAPSTSPTATTTTSATTRPTAGPTLPVIADREPRYAFNILTGAGGGVLVTRLDGSDVVKLGTDVPGVHKRDDWSPDGEHIVFVDEATNTMWIANLDGTPSTRVPGCDDGCDFPSFSPDGTRLAYSRWEDGAAVGPASVGIEIVELATGRVTPVVRLKRPLLADVPRWSPDGSQLVFGVDQMDDAGNETGAAIAIVPASGGEPHYLTDFSLFGYAPDWNRVTGEIVFSDSTKDARKGFDAAKETEDAFVIQPDGSGLRQVTHAAPGEQIKGAKWTPDGKSLLVYSTKTGSAVEIDPSTGAITNLPHPPNTGSARLRP